MSEVLDSPKAEFPATPVGFFPRLMATLLDTMFVLLLIGAITLFFSSVVFKDEVVGSHDVLLRYGWLRALDFVPIILVLTFWIKWGATPGKMLFKIKVVDSKTGGKISLVQAILRYLGYFVSTVFLLLGFFWVLFDKDKRGWHDMIAKTRVVYEA